MKGRQRIVSMEIGREEDVVLARQRARQIAGYLGFDLQDQTRIATALSEIVRNTFEYAKSGRVEFVLQDGDQFVIRVEDKGPGIRDLTAILDGRYLSSTGMGVGIIGAKRLMEDFEIKSAPGKGTTVILSRHLPPGQKSMRPSWTDSAENSREAPEERTWCASCRNRTTNCCAPSKPCVNGRRNWHN